MTTSVLIFAVYVPAYLFPRRNVHHADRLIPELGCFVELSPARAAAHAEVIIGVYFLSLQASVTIDKDVGCRQTTLQLLIRRHG